MINVSMVVEKLIKELKPQEPVEDGYIEQVVNALEIPNNLSHTYSKDLIERFGVKGMIIREAECSVIHIMNLRGV